jgi:hypothetical protein
MHPRLKLTEPESDFLRAWIWEEANFRLAHAPGAKTTQVEQSPYSAPALADIVTAAMSPAEQVAIAAGPPPEVGHPWPWMSDEHLRTRHQEAKQWLQHRLSREDGRARETAEHV